MDFDPVQITCELRSTENVDKRFHFFLPYSIVWQRRAKARAGIKVNHVINLKLVATFYRIVWSES